VHTFHRRRTRHGGSRISLVLLLAVTASAVSCGPPPPPEPPPVPLRIAFGIGPSAKLSGLRLLTDLLYNEPLISHDATGRPGPALAQSWQWEDEGRRLRLRLKPGVTFHDGTALTAPLVVRVLEAARNPGNLRRSLGFEHVTHIEATGELDIDIRLTQADVFLLTALNETRITHPDLPDIGTGPFELVRRTPSVEARRFDRYHGGLPGSALVQIHTYESKRAAWAALMRGEVDAAQEISREAVDFMERSSQIRTYSSPQPFYITLILNHERGPLADPRVRRALGHALNREKIVDWAMRGLGIVAEGPIWQFHWAYPPKGAPAAYSPGRAVELLQEAGHGLRPANGDGPAARLSFRCLFVNEDPQYERIALMVQRQLFDIGVDVELVPLTLAALAPRASAGDFDALLVPANAGRSLMFTHQFWHSPNPGSAPDLRTGYSGADPALDRLRASTSDDQLRESLRLLSERFRDDAPAVFIAWTEVTRAVNSEISVGTEPPHDPFTSIWKWRRLPAGAPQP
jgi:peptide/nickel transport system substrate-binding protein